MKLYKLTNGCGIWWIVAEHPTQAEEKLMTLLNKADYGFKKDRIVQCIELIAEKSDDERFITNYFLLI